MFPQDGKYFRFRFSLVLFSVAAFLSLISPTHEVSVPKECMEVALHAANTYLNDHTFLDAKVVNSFVDCTQKLYTIYKETDWKNVQNIIPQKVRDLVQKLGKNPSAILKRGGPGFLAAYLLYKSFDMYDRAMNLDVDIRMHRDVFELLQIEYQSLKDFMDEELIPLWEHLDSATSQMTSRIKLTEKLSRFHEALVQLLRDVYKDIKRGESDRRWTVAYGGASTAVCVGSIVTANVFGAFACVGVASDVYNFASFTESIKKLDLLLNEIKIMAIAISEYRKIPKISPTP